MKKILFFAAIAASLLVFAAAEELVPCAYDNAVVRREGALIQLAGEDRGIVVREDGTPALNGNGTQCLQNGYILVCEDNKTSVWSTDGKRITENFDEIPELAHDLAICGTGTWKKPGRLVGKFGAFDLRTGEWLLPQEFDSLTFSQDGQTLIANGDRVFDLNGKELDPLPSTPGRVDYENGMYAVRTDGRIALYYADGGIAIPGGIYDNFEAVCGDVVFAKKEGENTLYCLSLTGQELASFKGGYVAFSAADHDYVLLGKNGDAKEVAVVNRWGEMLSPYTEGDSILSSAGSNGRGMELFNTKTGKTRRLMADGREIPYTENSILLADLGLILYADEEPYLTDLDGNVIAEKGRYAQIEGDNIYYSLGFTGGKTLHPDGLTIRNAEGKNGLLKVGSLYSYSAHTWAQPEIDEAIAAGILSPDQQRDWRDGCTRGDFCRLITAVITAVIDASGKTLTERAVVIRFSDTEDAQILRAARLGIVNGVGNGKFAPNRPITRQEAATMLSRAADAIGVEATGEGKIFADSASFADWAADGISRITRTLGGGTPVMQGVSSDRFHALGTYTREQAILTMLRLYRAIEA